MLKEISRGGRQPAVSNLINGNTIMYLSLLSSVISNRHEYRFSNKWVARTIAEISDMTFAIFPDQVFSMP